MLQQRTGRIGFIFTLPAIIFFLGFILIPVFSTFFLSFTEWKGFNLANIRLSGLTNFANLFKDKVFFISLKNTFMFVIVTTAALNILGFLGASIIDSGIRATRLFKNLIFLPVLLSPIIIGIMWSRMLDAFGVINQFLFSLHVIKTPILFLGDQRVALYTVIGATIWQYTGYDMLLYYAGLQGVPEELIEAATIDGASKAAIKLKIILPVLSPVIAVTMLLNIVGGFKVFDIVYIMTAGGPNNSSHVFATYLFQSAFRFNKMGYASVIAIVIIFFSFIAAVIRLRIGREK
ncbi:MAG: sugar ABC transporter permease [Spirochaetales bacterium]|nr:MAG: sugar ABC transporter permease [Spirochaetales bacterium]